MDAVARDVRHLQGWLAVTEARVRHAVSARWEADPAPDDPVRGLYISEADVDRLLAGPAPLEVAEVDARVAELEDEALREAERGRPLRLSRLAGTFGIFRFWRWRWLWRR